MIQHNLSILPIIVELIWNEILDFLIYYFSNIHIEEINAACPSLISSEWIINDGQAALISYWIIGNKENSIASESIFVFTFLIFL